MKLTFNPINNSHLEQKTCDDSSILMLVQERLFSILRNLEYS